MKGQSWAVPFARSTPILYYNRDAFAKAGLPDRGPADLERTAVVGARAGQGAVRRPVAADDRVRKIDGDWQFQGNVGSSAARTPTGWT